ncbi:MAG: FtsX-like permease family protein [Anaeromyxobacteraceae bacterium]
MNDRLNPNPDPLSEPALSNDGAPAVAPPHVSLHVPKVFSAPCFLVAAVGVIGAPLVAAIGQVALADRASAAVAAGVPALAGALLALAAGALAAAIGRRVGFFEIAAAMLLLFGLLFGPVLAGARFGAAALIVKSWQAQGPLVVALGLLSSGLLAGTFTFAGATLGFLLFGSGRLDPSLSYELFVAKSHLRLSPRTLLALFVLVITGIAPGLLVAMVWSYARARRERRAILRGELTWRPRMPATLLMTLISIGGVAIGVWALTVVLSVMSGFETDLKDKILGTRSHGMVLKYGENDFPEWRNVREQVLAVPGIVGATPFLYREVMLSADQQLQGAILDGIDATTVGSVLDLPGKIQEGKLEWLAHPERIGGGQGAAAAAKVLPGIAIGKELAHTLRVFVGDTVNVISPLGDIGPAGPQPKSRPFRVAAVFYTGMYEYDSKFSYIDLAEAQRFFGAGESVSGLEVKVSDVDLARPILRRVVARLEGFPYRARDWGELNRNLFSALQMEKVVMAIILGFIVLVASFIIVATLIMQVLDKRREIAVLKSMGAGAPSVMKIFVAEGIIIGAIGTAFGLILGLGTCLLVDKVGIPLDPEVYYISNLPVRMNPLEFALVAVLALVLSYLATIYPASKASRLEPVEGLRSE